MARMIIVINLPDVDPTRVDPHDIAEDIVEVWNEDRDLHGDVCHAEVQFVSAEWED